MKKKKIIGKILICIVSIATIAVGGRGIKIYLRDQDPRWQMAKEIYMVQTALQEVDKDWKLESLSDVCPFVISGPDGVSINYYCCITSYLNEEPTEIDGLNKTALDFVVDIDTLDNRTDCNVGSWSGVRGERDGLIYLCWTVSPKYSCVMECTAGTVAEEDIFRMAESVSILQRKQE